ncbi:MAG: hypothetical protein V1774_09435 [Candidatus Eisenbacteria bacterium]
MKKIKVTKRVHAKVPWYEQPAILFSVIAVLLVGAGLLMAHLYRGTTEPDVILGGRERVDSTLVSNTGPGAAGTAIAEPAPHVLMLGDPFLEPAPGAVLPPLRAETLIEAAHVRERLRQARQLERHPESESELEPGEYGCVSGDALLARLRGESAGGRLELDSQCLSCCDFEVHCDRQGNTYLLAFIDLMTAEALAELGPGLDLAPAPQTPKSSFWQFWKKDRAPEGHALYHGSEILFYPDLNPEATSAVLLPFERIQATDLRRIRAGSGRPVEVLQARLR